MQITYLQEQSIAFQIISMFVVVCFITWYRVLTQLNQKSSLKQKLSLVWQMQL